MKQYLLSTLLLFSSSIVAASENGSQGDNNQSLQKLKIVESTITVKGKTAKVYELINESGDKVLIRRKEQNLGLQVFNECSEPTSLHWHGIHTPWKDDGVSFLTQLPIAPGNFLQYDFQLQQNGTFFAHSQYGLQDQKLMTMPVVIKAEKENFKITKDIVVFFEDFSFQSSHQIWQGLRKNLVDKRKLLGHKWRPNLHNHKASHGKHDLKEVNFDAFLTNRRTLENPDSYTVHPGDIVRLRCINASTATQFDVSLGKLHGRVVAVDGNEVIPILTNNFPLATSQRVDILVKIPSNFESFPILAKGQGSNMQTGIILNPLGKNSPSIPMEALSVQAGITNDFEKRLQAINSLPKKKIDRILNVNLEGSKQYYTWSINNTIWPKIKPLIVKEGERVQMVITNKSSMSHPIHLHGHTFQVVAIDDEKLSGALRDTVLVLPGQKVVVEFDANNPGIWALNCNIAYQAWGGMMTEVRYHGVKPLKVSSLTLNEYAQSYGGY
ncbi:MAG: multicopper oxidase family protein [Chlamydiae bacterium]|nr:multicopper oxidase family protein [Chlamydiota bacterium]